MSKDPARPAPDHADVLLPPPALFGGALLFGLIFDWLLGWHLPMPFFARSMLAAILVGIGLVPLLASLKALHDAKTAIPPWKSTRQIVISGPYKFSRNPIYIGMTLIYIGLVIWFGSGTGLLLLLPILATLHFGVVLREEAYLTRKFGEMYKNYCATTPRWLQ